MHHTTFRLLFAQITVDENTDVRLIPKFLNMNLRKTTHTKVMIENSYVTRKSEFLGSPS